MRDFMVVFGLLSAALDLLTFALLLQVFHASQALFRTGEFIGSALTVLAVLFVLRTRRPVLRNRSGAGLAVTSVAVTVLTLALPYLPPVASPLALVPPRASAVAALIGITASYVVSAEVVKRCFHRAVDAAVPVARPAGPPHVARQRRRLLRLVHEHGRHGGTHCRHRPRGRVATPLWRPRNPLGASGRAESPPY